MARSSTRQRLAFRTPIPGTSRLGKPRPFLVSLGLFWPSKVAHVLWTPSIRRTPPRFALPGRVRGQPSTYDPTFAGPLPCFKVVIASVFPVRIKTECFLVFRLVLSPHSCAPVFAGHVEPRATRCPTQGDVTEHRKGHELLPNPPRRLPLIYSSLQLTGDQLRAHSS